MPGTPNSLLYVARPILVQGLSQLALCSEGTRADLVELRLRIIALACIQGLGFRDRYVCQFFVVVLQHAAMPKCSKGRLWIFYYGYTSRFSVLPTLSLSKLIQVHMATSDERMKGSAEAGHCFSETTATNKSFRPR